MITFHRAEKLYDSADTKAADEMRLVEPDVVVSLVDSSLSSTNTDDDAFYSFMFDDITKLFRSIYPVYMNSGVN